MYDHVQQRDYAEEDYWRRYCPEHDAAHLDGQGRCPVMRAGCRHVWVAGMMYVDDADLSAVLAQRGVECERCGLVATLELAAQADG